MLKATATALIVGTLTIAAATQAHEMLDMLAPESAEVTSDANLRIVYSEALQQAYLSDSSVAEVLPSIVQDLGTQGLRYRVDGDSVVAETDWSCRRAVVEDTWLRITDC